MNITPSANIAYGAGLNPFASVRHHDGLNQTGTPVGQSNDQARDPSVNQESAPPVKANGEPSRPGKNTHQENSGKSPFLLNELSDAELRILNELKKTDTEVKNHEMAHVNAGGRYITSGARFVYKKGPDGNNYAVAGEVSIDVSPIPGDPQATIEKMKQVKNAALAPATPSAQDIKVASKATSNATKAMSDLMLLQAKEQAAKNTDQVFGDFQKAADSYAKIQETPENERSTFSIAV